MSSIKYIPLFHIELLHSYYADGLCKALTLLPSQHSQRTMRQFGLRFLPKTTGGALYARVEKAGADWKLPHTLPEGLFLQFLLTDESGLFYPVTQFPTGYKPGQLMLFSNLHNNLDAGKPLLVKNTGTHLLSDQDLVEKAKNSYAFAKAAAAPATLKLQLQHNGQFLQIDSPLYQGEVSASFNLQKLDYGLADLLVDAVLEKSVYLLPADATGHTVGIVDIFYKASLPAAYQFMSPAGIVQTKTYHIPFAAAQARWRYKVKRSFNDAITGISIAKPNPGGISFNTVNGADPGTFISTSATAIPLADRPVKGIALSNQSNKVIVPNLPNPGISQIVTDTDGLIYADMLVTV